MCSGKRIHAQSADVFTCGLSSPWESSTSHTTVGVPISVEPYTE